MSEYNEYPVILLGAGPACIAAAIQLQRSKTTFLMISKEVGGLIANANLIENLLGFPRGISGSNFVDLLAKQVKNHSIEILEDEVRAVSLQAEKYVVHTGKNEFFCKYLIIGTGTLPNQLEIPGEVDLFAQKKLFYEIKNIPLIAKAEKWMIIGSGDAAYDYALNLAKFSEKVTILQRSADSKALPLLMDRVKKNPKITVLEDVIAHEFKLKGSKIHLDRIDNGQKVHISADRVLVAIGRSPNLAFLSKSLSCNGNDHMMEESLFLVGDVKNNNFRQVSIAMGDGLRAAMTILGKFK